MQRHIPGPGSNRGYKPYHFVEPLLLMLYGGGRHLEDLREIREDKALKKTLGTKKDACLLDGGGLVSEDG